jgi:hypothetical protein
VSYDDETLMAYADGELDAAQRAAIGEAAERDPELARRIELHRALRAEVSGAFATVLDEPVPERLVATARGRASPGNVLRFPQRTMRAPGAAWRGREWGAMAASLALGALISWKLFAPGEAAFMSAGGGALVARGELATALDQQLASTQRRENTVLIGLTFKARDGNFCRSFTLRATHTAGLACRVGADWQIPVTAAADVPAGGLQQAASMPPAVLQVIETRMGAEALDAAGEENARRGGWDAKR